MNKQSRGRVPGDRGLRLISLLAVAAGVALLILIVSSIFSEKRVNAWPGDLHSALTSNYSADADEFRLAPLMPAIILDVALDQLVGQSRAEWRTEPGESTVVAWLSSPVPEATVAPGEVWRTPVTEAPNPTPMPPPTLSTPTDHGRTATAVPSVLPTMTVAPSPTVVPSSTTTPELLPTPSATLDLSPIPSPTTPPTATAPPPATNTSAPVLPTTVPSTATHTPTATTVPDLGLSVKVASQTEIFPGQPMTYTIKARNNTAVVAADVVVQDAVPITFTLQAGSMFGPPVTVTDNTILWGPIDIPPMAEMSMGFGGHWQMDDTAPKGDRGVWFRNRALIVAPWFTPPLARDADVFVLYPPVLQVVSGSLTPTTVYRHQVVRFQVQVLNEGWADATATTNSYLQLTDSGANVQTSWLSDTVDLPADGVARWLTFEPLSISFTSPNLAMAKLSLERLDTNGVTDTDVFTDVGQVSLLPGPHIVADTTLPVGSVLLAGSVQHFIVSVHNEGSISALVRSGTDSIQISASDDWGAFDSLAAAHLPLPVDRWQGELAGPTTARWVSSPSYGPTWSWQPFNPPIDNDSAAFEFRTTAPTVPGVYTVTVQAVLNNGDLVNTQQFAYTVY